MLAVVLGGHIAPTESGAHLRYPIDRAEHLPDQGAFDVFTQETIFELLEDFVAP